MKPGTILKAVVDIYIPLRGDLPNELEGTSIQMKTGDLLYYIGDSKAVVLNGEAEGWRLTLTVGAPIEAIYYPENPHIVGTVKPGVEILL